MEETTVVYNYMYWNCPTCGTKRIRGDKQSCPNCADLIPNRVDVFYQPSDAEVITDPAEIALADSGPYWQCEHCSHPNLQVLSNCRSCGAPKGNSPDFQGDEDPFAAKNSRMTARSTQSGLIDDMYDYCSMPNDPGVEAQRTPAPSTPFRDPFAEFDRADARRRGLITFGVVATLLLIGLGLWFYFKTTPVELVIDTLSWERQIDLEEWRTVSEGDWSVPTGAHDVVNSRKIHHYDSVYDHTERRSRQVRVRTGSHTETERHTVNLRNGRSKTVTSKKTVTDYGYKTEHYDERIYRQEPVYHIWYNYQIEKWVFARTLSAGTADKQPKWPEFTPIPGKLRERGRSATYRVVLARKDDVTVRWPFELPEDRWQGYQLQQPVIGHLNTFGVLLTVDWPGPAPTPSPSPSSTTVEAEDPTH